MLSVTSTPSITPAPVVSVISTPSAIPTPVSYVTPDPVMSTGSTGVVGSFSSNTEIIPLTNKPLSATNAVSGARTIGTKQVSRSYTYDVTPADLAKEQQAFQPGEGV